MDNQQLVLEKQRLGGDGANTTGAEEFGDRDDEVNREDEEVAHRRNATIPTILRKTARNILFGINSRITN
jgi:hypothetical protein